jgi:hypothetical protein
MTVNDSDGKRKKSAQVYKKVYTLFLYRKGVKCLMVICSESKTCRSAPACQHGKPHDPMADCTVRECFVGGQVRCKPVMPVAKYPAGPETLAENVDSITRDFEERR